MVEMHPYEIEYLISLIPLAVIIIVPLLVTIVGVIRWNHRGSPGMRLGGCIGTIVAFLLLSMLLPSYIKSPLRARESEAKANCHAIQIAVERYGADHQGLYPENTDVLLTDGYLEHFPMNAFTWEPMIPMIEVDFGSPDYPGNFSYLPYVFEGEITGYYLLGYTDENEPGQDINADGIPDHVIIVVNSHDPGNPDASLPELSEYLSVYQPDPAIQ